MSYEQSQDSSLTTVIPTIKWAQNINTIYLTIELIDYKDVKFSLNGNKISFSTIQGNKMYAFEGELCGEVKENYNLTENKRYILIELFKASAEFVEEDTDKSDDANDLESEQNNSDNSNTDNLESEQNNSDEVSNESVSECSDITSEEENTIKWNSLFSNRNLYKSNVKIDWNRWEESDDEEDDDNDFDMSQMMQQMGGMGGMPGMGGLGDMSGMEEMLGNMPDMNEDDDCEDDEKCKSCGVDGNCDTEGNCQLPESKDGEDVDAE